MSTPELTLKNEALVPGPRVPSGSGHTRSQVGASQAGSTRDPHSGLLC